MYLSWDIHSYSGVNRRGDLYTEYGVVLVFSTPEDELFSDRSVTTSSTLV